jgi:hypothetical protein
MWVEHPRAADRPQQKREGKGRPEHRRAEIASGGGDRAARREGRIFKNAAIAAQGDLIVSATVDVIEDDAWQSPFGHSPEVGDVHDTWRREARHRDYW